MSPVDRAGSVTEMKLVSVHMVTLSPFSEMKKWRRDHSGVKRTNKPGEISRFSLFKQPQISKLTIK